MIEAEEKAMNAVNMSLAIRDKVVVERLRQEKIIQLLDSEVVRRMNDIKGMLDRSHVLLKYLSPVMKFDGKTTSAPLAPLAVQQELRSLDFLMFANPEKPNGLLLFMGDAENSNKYRQKRQAQECGSDYLAVELKAARPHLKMCTSGNYLDFETDKDIPTDGKHWSKVQFGM